MKDFTAQEFAKLLYAELNAEHWGDIDPYIFKELGDGGAGWADPEHVEAMEKVLNKVLEKMKRNEKA